MLEATATQVSQTRQPWRVQEHCHDCQESYISAIIQIRESKDKTDLLRSFVYYQKFVTKLKSPEDTPQVPISTLLLLMTFLTSLYAVVAPLGLGFLPLLLVKHLLPVLGHLQQPLSHWSGPSGSVKDQPSHF